MRRFALFGVTVMFPCALLVVFGYRMVRQDRELAARHAEEEQRARALQERQGRLAALERWKRTAAEEFFTGRNPSVAFAALVIDHQVRPPWPQTTEVSSGIDPCERTEFAAGKLAEAIDCYARSLSEGGNAWRVANIRLLLGRALLKAGHSERALRENLELLRVPVSVIDDQGVPFAWYAADRLLRSPATVETVRNHFLRNPPRDPLSPSAAYLLRNIAERLGDAGLRETAAAAAAFAGRVETLRAALPGLLPLLRREDPEPVWEQHGDWLIGLAKAPESGKELLAAIDAKSVSTPKTMEPPTDPPPRTDIYIASLGLVFLIATSGAYLLWRDIRRDFALSNLRSQFVASVSHELKTPLTAIRMFAETLRMRPDGDPAVRAEYLDTIVNESERLSRLVDNVLDFSKIEQGRKLYHFQETSIAAVIDCAVRAARYPLGQADIELRVTAASDLPALRADADALQQAVLNLLTNAMKYSNGCRHIDLDARHDHDAVIIAVRDYGVGISEEHQPRIFERFYRVPSPENQHVPGAGLGLTLVAHIAKAHGGEVLLESQPGAGSIFSLRLPLEYPA